MRSAGPQLTAQWGAQQRGVSTQPPRGRFLSGIAWLTGLLACFWLLVGPIPAAAETRLVINGVAENIEQNIRLVTGNPNTLRPELLELFVQTLPLQAAEALAALGYFTADVDVTREVVPREIDARAEKDSTSADADNPPVDTVLTLDILLNDPVRINKIDLRILGVAREDADYMPSVANIALRKGAIFNSGTYESTKSVLLDQAENLGYFDFAFTRSEVRVSKTELTANITLLAESGPRYTFGALVFDNDVLDDRFLQRWVPFESGDPYQASYIADLTKALQSSGYFQSVRVIPQRDNRYGKTVPVSIELKGRDTHEVGVGAGFATDTGIRGKLTWAIPRVNRRGHSVKTAFEVSQIRQNVTAAYRIPRGDNPLQNYYGLEYGLLREDKSGLENVLSSLRVQRVTERPHDWQESLFVRHDRERSTIGDDTDDTTLILMGFNYSRTRSKGRPFLTWGQSSNVQVMGGNEQFGSSIDFAKFTFSLKYLRAIDKRNTAIVSLQYGVISSNNYSRVPLSQRFFAGGDNSVRGFGFRTIGPTDIEGQVVGGRYFEVAGFELNRRIRDRWSLAMFVDSGRAFNTIDTAYSVGAGVGVRWQSPVGPFRLDVARPVSDNDGDDIRLHLSLGPEI